MEFEGLAVSRYPSVTTPHELAQMTRADRRVLLKQPFLIKTIRNKAPELQQYVATSTVRQVMNEKVCVAEP